MSQFYGFPNGSPYNNQTRGSFSRKSPRVAAQKNQQNEMTRRQQVLAARQRQRMQRDNERNRRINTMIISREAQTGMITPEEEQRRRLEIARSSANRMSVPQYQQFQRDQAFTGQHQQAIIRGMDAESQERLLRGRGAEATGNAALTTAKTIIPREEMIQTGMTSRTQMEQTGMTGRTQMETDAQRYGADALVQQEQIRNLRPQVIGPGDAVVDPTRPDLVRNPVVPPPQQPEPQPSGRDRFVTVTDKFGNDRLFDTVTQEFVSGDGSGAPQNATGQAKLPSGIVVYRLEDGRIVDAQGNEYDSDGNPVGQ